MGFTTSLLPSFAGGSGGAIAGGNPAATAAPPADGSGGDSATGGFYGLFSLLQGAAQTSSTTPSGGLPALPAPQLATAPGAAAAAANGTPLPAAGGALPPLAQLGAGVTGDAAVTAAEDGVVADPLAALAALGWRQRLNGGGEGEGVAASAPAELTAGDSDVTEAVDPAVIDPTLVAVAGQTPPPAIDAATAMAVPTGPRSGAVPGGLVASGAPAAAANDADAMAFAGQLANGDSAGNGQQATVGQGVAAGQGSVAASGDFGELVQALESEAATGGDTGTADTAAPLVREPAGRTTAAPAAATAHVPVPVGRPGWSEAVMEKVMWFSSQLIDSAEIQLSPPELGPVQVRIATQHEQASVYFASHNAGVREVLEQALPRLRELFESQGLQLADAGVGERGFDGQRESPQGQAAGRDAARGYAASEGDDAVAEVAPTPVRVGLVDAYA